MPRPTSSSFGRTALLLFLLALAVRVLGLTLRGGWTVPPQVGAEAGVVAQHLLAGQGFATPFSEAPSPSTHLPPLYPVFLAGLTWLQHALGAGGGALRAGNFVFSAAVAVNLVASSLLPVVAVAVARRAEWPARVGLVAGLALCLCPEAVRAAGLVWDEALFALAAAGMIWLLVRELRRPVTWAAPVRLGLAGGVLSLLNPAFTLALGAAWVAGLWGRRWRALAGQVGVLLAAVVAGGLPWHVRNWVRLDPPARVFVRGNFPLEVWTSINPVARGADGTLLPRHPWNGTDPLVRDGRPLAEQEYFEWCRERAWRGIAANPAAYARHVAAQVEAFWLGTGEARRWQRSQAVFFAAQGIPALLGIAGLVLARRRIEPPLRRAFGAILLVFPLPYYLSGGAARYRHPIDLVLYLGIGWLLWLALEWLAQGRAAAPQRAIKTPPGAGSLL